MSHTQTKTPTPQGENCLGRSAFVRRVMFAVNVAMVIFIAFVIATLLSWVSFKTLHDTRIDMTALQQYSLSKQTKAAIAQVKQPIQITAILGGDEAATERAGDLLNEYELASNQITVRLLDPATDVQALQNFEKSIHDRFQSDIEPYQSRIRLGRALISRARSHLSDLIQQTKVLDDLPFGGPGAPVEQLRLRTALTQSRDWLARVEPEIFTPAMERVDNALTGPLPRYKQALQLLERALSSYMEVLARNEGLLQQARVSGSDAVSEQYLRLMRTLREALEPTNKSPTGTSPNIGALADGILALKVEADLTGYEDATARLARQNAIVLEQGERLVVSSLDSALADDKESQGFLSEELLTSALLRLNQATNRPRVVLINPLGRPVIDRGAAANESMNLVAQRLRRLNFEVVTWAPFGPKADATKMQDPPTMSREARTVWVLLPAFDGQLVDRPFIAQNLKPVVEHLQQVFAAGDGVMIFTNPGQVPEGATMSSADGPLLRWLGELGINVQTDKMLLRQIVQRGVVGARPDHPVQDWPTDSVITRALKGLGGIFIFASPIELSPNADPSAKLQPLVEIAEPDLFLEHRLIDFSRLRGRITMQDGQAVDSALVGAAAEKGSGRLVVYTSPVFARDTIAGRQASGTAGGALEYPANAELFVNSVAWLADAEGIIASSPQTKAIPRVEPLEPAALSSLRWGLSAGLPLIVLLFGLGVWLIRRRG